MSDSTEPGLVVWSSMQPRPAIAVGAGSPPVHIGRHESASRLFITVPNPKLSGLAVKIWLSESCDGFLVRSSQSTTASIVVDVPGHDSHRLRQGNGVFLTDRFAHLSLVTGERGTGGIVELAALKFTSTDDALGSSFGTAPPVLPVGQAWWVTLVAIVGPTLIARRQAGEDAARLWHERRVGPQPQTRLAVENPSGAQISQWFDAAGRRSPSSEMISSHAEQALRWLGGRELPRRQHGVTIAALHAALAVGAVTIADVAKHFPAEVPIDLRSRPADGSGW